MRYCSQASTLGDGLNPRGDQSGARPSLHRTRSTKEYESCVYFHQLL